MLTISTLESSNPDAKDEGDFVLEDISFDDLFVGFDELPDLEIDPCDIFADFSFNSSEEGDGNNKGSTSEENDVQHKRDGYYKEHSGKEETEVVSARTREDEKKPPSSKSENVKSLKSSGKKSSQSKKKAKVDWTPELHRRFVQAVEQLGVDKAVPSRILELMGIDCLTRHNIASHLQKYRSHRKHLLAREAEAASWSHRRQLYVSSANNGGGGGKTMNMEPSWAPQPQPMVGFPPTMHHPQHQNFRPLHVWGHPQAVEHPQLVPVWPRPPWGTPRPVHGPVVPADPTYWHHHPHYNQRTLTQGMPCYPPPLIPQARYSTPPVAGIPPAHPAIFRSPPPPQTVPFSKKHSGPRAQSDAQPSKESIDAAIEDVLAKPWLPLPLGLKPPSLDSVMVELQKQGVANL